jgi:hypothetical protein
MSDDNLTPEQWESEVKEKLEEFISNLLSVSKGCNMATKYSYPIKEVYETHTDYDETKVKSVELRIVFDFIKELPVKDMVFI